MSATVMLSKKGVLARAAGWLGAVAAGLGIVAGLSSPALAQNDSTLPPQLLNNSRTAQGDQLRFCVDDFSPGAAFNKAVSQAMADALLVKAVFAPAPSGFPLNGQGYMDELQLVMNNDCDVMVGIALDPNAGDSAYPSWATVTRPFAQIPFVLAVSNPAYTALKDVPFGTRIGTTLGSAAQGALLTYIGEQPPAQRWKQLPYGDPKLMLKRVLDGTIEAMAIYLPSLLEITNNDPAAAGVRIVPLTPLPQPVASVGNLVSVRDSYLRAQLDTAIANLISDGTITKLLEQFGYTGAVAGP